MEDTGYRNNKTNSPRGLLDDQSQFIHYFNSQDEAALLIEKPIDVKDTVKRSIAVISFVTWFPIQLIIMDTALLQTQYAKG